MKLPRRVADNKRTLSKPTSPHKTAPRRLPKGENLRLVVAIAAAKLIAEGMVDYGGAKQKAAQKLGVTNIHCLPNNQEIEAALREHLVLFKSDTQPRILQALRTIAVQVMRALAPYSPYLVGSVLTGTATEFSEIELELIGVEAKECELYLLNKGVEFRMSAEPHHAGKTRHCEVISYQFVFAEASVRVTLFESHAARQSMRASDSNRFDRADIATVEKLLSGGNPSS